MNVRHEMLEEAIDDHQRRCSTAATSTAPGEHFRVDSAKLWDLPDRRVPIATAVSGDQSVQKFAPLSDAPGRGRAARPSWWTGGARPGRAVTGAIGQMPICWGPDEDDAVRVAHEQFRWFGGGWKVNAELPGPDAFAGATQFVRREDVADSIPCGPDVTPIVEAAKQWKDAGFTDLAFVQIGDETQEEYIRWAEKDLLPALREI